MGSKTTNFGIRNFFGQMVFLTDKRIGQSSAFILPYCRSDHSAPVSEEA
jgi:hypothetical protein